MMGKRCGDWLIVGDPQRIGRDLRYPCRCVCGATGLVSAITLWNGKAVGCGCVPKAPRASLKDPELAALPQDISEVFLLISQGYLPPADQFTLAYGAPCWTMPSLAKILGVKPAELIAHLQAAGQRFSAFTCETNDVGSTPPPSHRQHRPLVTAQVYKNAELGEVARPVDQK